ncbi:MAG TPA: glycosyltransferase [Thermoanaerobaculia bacterium]|nr:glycosyltransferase [Thermoanaerobaculia bacterium]
MNARAEVTVAVATLDRPDGLRRCLTALAEGTLRPAEVVVVDQGSGAEGAVAAARQAGLEVVHLRQERRGLAASRNAAWARAAQPFVAVTDDDCVPDAGWVAALARAFAAADAPDAVTGRVLPLGADEPGLYAVSSRTGAARADFAGRALPWLVGTGGNFALRREWLARVGRYDERLGAGTPGGAGEDMDLLYRLLRAGARIRYEPEAVVYHERQTRPRRLATRASYGRGIGACCGLWLRGRDLHALAILGQWLVMRARLLVGAARRGRWSAAREEILVLAGTAGGLLYGLRGGRTA